MGKNTDGNVPKAGSLDRHQGSQDNSGGQKHSEESEGCNLFAVQSPSDLCRCLLALDSSLAF